MTDNNQIGGATKRRRSSKRSSSKLRRFYKSKQGKAALAALGLGSAAGLGYAVVRSNRKRKAAKQSSAVASSPVKRVSPLASFFTINKSKGGSSKKSSSRRMSFSKRLSSSLKKRKVSPKLVAALGAAGLASALGAYKYRQYKKQNPTGTVREFATPSKEGRISSFFNRFRSTKTTA